MSTKSTAEKKDLATQKNETANVKNAEQKETPKVANLQVLDKYKPEPFKTAEERINLKNQFDELAKRYEQLKVKFQDFKQFKAGDDKVNAKVTFKNALGYEFIVNNSNVIEVLKKAALDELQILLNEAENEVLTFEM